MKIRLPAQRLRKLRDADDGQALVLVCLGLMMLLMVASLGVDVGYLRYQKQQMQKAADAGAIAAAAVIGYNGTLAQVTAAGRNEVAANGFTNGVDGVTVTINNPPAAGDPFAGNSNYVQVIVAQPRPTFFWKVTGLATVNVSSHSVASAAANSSGCMYAMDPNTDSGTVSVNGVNLSSTCGIYVNSNSQTALVNTGTTHVDATGIGIGIVGGSSGTGISPNPVIGIPPFKDPLGTVPAPTYRQGCDLNGQQVINTSGTYNLRSGLRYCGGISISGDSSVTVNFAPGTYYLIGGGLTISGTPTVNGSEVMFYNTSGTYAYAPVSIAGNAGIQLSAPTTGTYAGILFFQDRSIPVGSSSSSFNGSQGAVFTGALYFSTTTVNFLGSPTNVASYSPIVAWMLVFSGADSTIRDDFLPNNGSPIRSAQLVE